MQERIILWQNSKGAFVMKQLKKLVIAGALGVLTLALAGCGGGDKKAEKAKPDTSKPVIVGVNPGPHAIIMENVKKIAE